MHPPMKNACPKAVVFHWCHLIPKEEMNTMESGSEELDSMVATSSQRLEIVTSTVNSKLSTVQIH